VRLRSPQSSSSREQAGIAARALELQLHAAASVAWAAAAAAAKAAAVSKLKADASMRFAVASAAVHAAEVEATRACAAMDDLEERFPVPLSAAAQAAFDRRLLVLNLTVCAGYWAEVDGCIGVCADFATDTAKDGLHYAARDAAKADAAYTGLRVSGHGPPQQGTRLHQAAQAGLAGRMRVLLAAGADVNARNKFGCTPLFMAAACGHAAVVAVLLAFPDVSVNGSAPLGQVPYDRGRLVRCIPGPRTIVQDPVTRHPRARRRGRGLQ